MKRILLFFSLLGMHFGMYAEGINFVSIQADLAGKDLGEAVKRSFDNPVKFEFWNQSGNPMYIKIGTLLDEMPDFIKLDSGARLVSPDNIVRMLYSYKPQPAYIEDVDFFIFNPAKTVYVTLKDNKFQPQTRTVQIGPRKTKSGLSLANNVQNQDMAWFPYSGLSYNPDSKPLLISVVRTSEEKLDGLEVYLQLLHNEGRAEDILDDINAPGIRGWTAMHEAAFQGYTLIYNFLIQSGGDKNSKDIFGRAPQDVWGLAQIPGTYYIPAIRDLIVYFNGYIQQLNEYIESAKKDEILNLPEYSESKVNELVSLAQQEYQRSGQIVKDELFGFIEKQADTYLKKFGQLNQASTDIEYADYDSFWQQIIDALGGNKKLIGPEELYAYIGLDKNQHNTYSLQKIKEKVEEKRKELSYPERHSPTGLTLREIEHKLLSFKPAYDAALQGEQEYKQIRADHNQKISADKLSEDIQIVATFSDSIRRVFSR